jgi:hypothetical protein
MQPQKTVRDDFAGAAARRAPDGKDALFSPVRLRVIM